MCYNEQEDISKLVQISKWYTGEAAIQNGKQDPSDQHHSLDIKYRFGLKLRPHALFNAVVLSRADDALCWGAFPQPLPRMGERQIGARKIRYYANNGLSPLVYIGQGTQRKE